MLGCEYTPGAGSGPCAGVGGGGPAGMGGTPAVAAAGFSYWVTFVSGFQ